MVSLFKHLFQETYLLIFKGSGTLRRFHKAGDLKRLACYHSDQKQPDGFIQNIDNHLARKKTPLNFRVKLHN